MKRQGLLAAVVLAGASLGSGSVQARAPDLAACPRPEAPDSGERERTQPLPIPASLRGIVRSSLLHYAIASQGGATICIDTSWMNEAEWNAPDPNSRFLSFGWYGYETYGHILIDRTGRGQMVEIGAKPVFSPSRQRLAAVDQTESEFGTLSGLAIWQVRATGLSELAKVQNIPRMTDWRIDSWAGESCINLSARPLTSEENARRTRYVARPAARGWSVTRSAASCPRP